MSHRGGLHPSLLWLWCRLAAVALIRPLVRELPYVAGAALKKKRKKERKKERKGNMRETLKDMEDPFRTSSICLAGIPERVETVKEKNYQRKVLIVSSLKLSN